MKSWRVPYTQEASTSGKQQASCFIKRIIGEIGSSGVQACGHWDRTNASESWYMVLAMFMVVTSSLPYDVLSRSCV